MVTVFETDLAVDEGLPSGLAIAEPEKHAFAIEVLWPAMGDVGEVDSGSRQCLTPATEVADCGVIMGSVATAVHFGP